MCGIWEWRVFGGLGKAGNWFKQGTEFIPPCALNIGGSGKPILAHDARVRGIRDQ